MSVTSETTVLSYAADGATVGPYPLTGLERSADIDIKLYVNSAPWTDFTISSDGLRTGTVLSLGTALTIYRETPKTQAQPFPPNTTPAAEDISAGLDKLTFISQDLSEQVSRGIIAPRGSAAPVGGFVKTPNTTLGQDTTGTFVSRTTAQELAHLGITDQGVLPTTVAATNTLTIHTDPDVGPMTLVIGGENVVFPSSTTYNQDSAAIAIAGIINAGSFAVTAVAAGQFVIVSAVLPGADGNEIACTISVGGAYGTWASAATTGGTLSGVVLSGIAQVLTTTQQEQAQRNMGIYRAPYIVQGTGIDPTGATPSSDGLNAFFLANKRGEFYIPEGFYWLDKTVKLYESATYTGAGSTPYQPTGHTPGVTTPAGTVFFTKESAEYPFVVDADGDRTMFVSETWTKTSGDWMHNFGFQSFGVDGDKVADYGMKIYQMGEVGHITDCTFQNCKKAGVLAAGAHAPFTMRNCSVLGPGALEVTPNTTPKTWVNDDPYTGLHFAAHPTFIGSAGEIRLIGLSGDGNNGGIIRVSGGHTVTVFGAKFENNSFKTILFDAEGKGGDIGKGGGAASITFIGGNSQDATSTYKYSEELIRIEEGVTPVITMQGFSYTKGETIDQAAFGYLPSLIRNVATASFAQTAPTGTVYPIPFSLDLASELKLYVNGVLSADTITVTGAGTTTVNVTTAVEYTVGAVLTFRRDAYTGEVIPNLNNLSNVKTSMLTYGPGISQLHSHLQLGIGTKVFGTVGPDSWNTPPVHPEGRMSEILELGSDEVTNLRAFNANGAGMKDATGAVKFKINNTGVGFNAEAPIAKPAITGSRASADAMVSLLAALVSYGLITDGTSA